MQIKIIKAQKLKDKPDFSNLGFGNYYTDHMFEMDYIENEGFVNPLIRPYEPLQMDPASLVLHYAQETFEGLKAYKNDKNEILLFRPEMNAKRFQKSNERLCMPQVPVEDFVLAIKELVALDSSWIPTLPNTSLYIRPFMFAYEAKLGVHAAKHYKFMIILSPVGSYYKAGLNPVKIYVEEKLVRAVKGGTGFAKCGGNYAASILAQQKAEEMGFSQVLWLDGNEHKYVEEVGTMNAMFVINDEVITAPIDGSVLPGVTRDSCITILKDLGYKVSERPLSIDELMKAALDGSLNEAFGTGTAAVISPIGVLKYKDTTAIINNGETGKISKLLYDTITGIQTGVLKDKYNWTIKINKN